MSKLFAFFNQQQCAQLHTKDLKNLQSITVLQNKNILFHFGNEEVLLSSSLSVVDKEVEDLFSPKHVERCPSTNIEVEGIVHASPDVSPKTTEEPKEKLALQEATEFVSSFITPDRKTKPQLVNVSPKRILKKAKMEEAEQEEKKDN